MTPLGMLRARAAQSSPVAPRTVRAEQPASMPLTPHSAAGHGAQGDPATASRTVGLAHETAAAECPLSQPLATVSAPANTSASPRLGRPTLLAQLGLETEAGEQLRLFARRMVLAHNRTRRGGSYSLALRLAAKNPLAPEAFRAWVESRKDQHSIPPSLRAWIDVPSAVQQFHRAPTEAQLRGLYVPDSMRLHMERGDRLRAGERFSADDGSVNFVVFVDWPWGGCPCSDKFGVRVGRYQLLALHDDATGYVPHFSWIARASDAYRAEDIATFLHAPFAQLGVWDTALLERGSWESHRVSELLALAGVERETAYEPNQKLVEGWWNRAWTLLSNLPGQIGRFRGEEEAAAALVEKYRRGSRDPRLDLISLPDAANAIARVVAELNATRMDCGPLWGSWVPAERWAADLAVRPLRQLPANVEPMTRPERRELMVRRWAVHCEAMSPAGEALKYEFFDDALIAHEGKRVLVYFDPQDDPCTAAIYALDGRTVIAARATCISRAPALIRDAAGYRLDWDHGQIERARAAKAQARAAVRREHRTLAPDGTVEAYSTEVRDARERAVAAMARSPRGTAAEDTQSATTPAESAPALSRTTPPQACDSARGGTSSAAPSRAARSEPTEDDLAELERLEARARSAGIIPLHVPDPY